MPGDIRHIGARIAWFEQALAQTQRDNDPDRTLFVQLTEFEVFLVQFGLWWISRIYGPASTLVLIEKLHSLIGAQRFCDCDQCQEEREEKEEE